MESRSDGLALARQRVAEEARHASGILDLGRLGLHDLPEELFALSQLRVLCLGDGYRRADGAWIEARSDGPPNRLDHKLPKLAALPALRELSLAGTGLGDAATLTGLGLVEVLDCARTQLTGLAALYNMAALRRLDISGTSVAELSSLMDLRNLETVVFSHTPVQDLAPLSGLDRLRHVDCSSSDVTDLQPLANLHELRVLLCADTRIASLGPIAGLTGLHRLICAGAQIEDLAPLAALRDLRVCDCSRTLIVDLLPLAKLAGLQQFYCSETDISDLAPLARSTGLRVLFCADTRVTSLQPLANLGGLRGLDCSRTGVHSLAPLENLTGLQVLHCSQTLVGDLRPLAGLTELQVVNCSATFIRDLSPLRTCAALQVLSCAQTEVADLGPLDCMLALREFSCSGTKVSNLAPLGGLQRLQWLSCSATQVTDLEPVAGMAALRWLSCSGTRVSDLSPLGRVRSLQWLDASDCHIDEIPRAVLGLASLRDLRLFRTIVEHVPAEVLSQSKRDNCLEALRAHYADLEEGTQSIPDVKIVILGNGRVGKTQISRKLCNEEFESRWDSTHGIAVRASKLVDGNGTATAHLQIWDFGGQDIYHGTHALFLRTRAVFVIAWSADVENTPDYEHQGIRFQNHRLGYWMKYVRQFGDPGSPILIVQTKCDAAVDDVPDLPGLDEAWADSRNVRVLQYSSANDRGRVELHESLHAAVAALCQNEHRGDVTTGAGRARVRRRLEALRETDAARPPAARQSRFLDRAAFMDICQEEGGVGSPEQLLAYLNNAGAVFYRRGLFDGLIVLDQSWALDGIYAVFQRERCYRQIRAAGGVFTRPMLHDLVWSEYPVNDQRLFLSMMLSCNICFAITPGGGPDDDSTEFVAPDLLVDREVVQEAIDREWDPAEPEEVETFVYRLLPPGLLRNLIARIGRLAGQRAIYWRNGVQIYESTTRSYCRIEQKTGANADERDGSGSISVRAQGRQARYLLTCLSNWVEEAQWQAGMRPEDVTRTSDESTVLDAEAIGVFGSQAEPELVFGPPLAGNRGIGILAVPPMEACSGMRVSDMSVLPSDLDNTQSEIMNSFMTLLQLVSTVMDHCPRLEPDTQ